MRIINIYCTFDTFIFHGMNSCNILNVPNLEMNIILQNIMIRSSLSYFSETEMKQGKPVNLEADR